MAEQLAVLLELERRGKLPADKKALLDEARKRGLVGKIGILDAFNKQTHQGPYAPPPPDVSQNPENSVLPGVLGQLSNTFRAATQGVQDTATLNMGDELAAGVKTLIDPMVGQGFDYGKNLQQAEKITADTVALNPDAYRFGQNAGVVGLVGKAGVGSVATTAPSIPRAALTSGGISAVIGAGQPGSIAERAKSATVNAIIGTAIGAAGGYIGSKLFAAPKTGVPTVSSLDSAAADAFKVARKSGATITQPAAKNLASGLKQTATDLGLVTPSGKVADYPSLSHALSLADDYGTQPMTMDQLMVLRSRIADVAGGKSKAERMVGVQLLKQMDDTIAGLNPAVDFVPGGATSPDAAVQAWKAGRDLFSNARRAEDIQALINAATKKSQRKGTPLGVALQDQFDKFASDPKNLRGFNADEIAAIKTVADGTAFSNAMKNLGSLAPRSWSGVTFKGGAPFAVGTVLGGPAAGATLAGGTMSLGVLGRTLSRLSAAQQAELASVLVANGGVPPKVIPSTVAVPVKNALRSMIMIVGSSRGPEMTKAIGEWLAPQRQVPASP